MSAEKVLLRWMNFHLKKAGHKKTVSNFSSDVKVMVLDFAIWVLGTRLVSILIIFSILFNNQLSFVVSEDF